LAQGITNLIHLNGKSIKRVNYAWDAVRRAAGGARRDGPHILRHTAATWFMNSGVDVAMIAGWLGMSNQTLLDMYGHHHPMFQQTIAQVTPKKPTNRKGTL
jgi:integrase